MEGRLAAALMAGLVAATMVSAGSLATGDDDRTQAESYLLVGVDSDGHEIVRELRAGEAGSLDDEGTCTYDPEANACSTGPHGPDSSIALGWVFPLSSGLVHGDFQASVIGTSGASATYTCSITTLLGDPIPYHPGFECHFEPGRDFPHFEVYTHQCYAYAYGESEPGGTGSDGWIDLPAGSIQCMTDHW